MLSEKELSERELKDIRDSVIDVAPQQLQLISGDDARLLLDHITALDETLATARQETERLEDEIEEWQLATGLEDAGGDPSGITPAMLAITLQANDEIALRERHELEAAVAQLEPLYERLADSRGVRDALQGQRDSAIAMRNEMARQLEQARDAERCWHEEAMQAQQLAATTRDELDKAQAETAGWKVHAEAINNLLAYAADKQDKAQTEAAAMREALEGIGWDYNSASGHGIHRRRCCGAVHPKQHEDDCPIGQALSGTAGQALLDRLARAEVDLARIKYWLAIALDRPMSLDVDEFYRDEPEDAATPAQAEEESGG